MKIAVGWKTVAFNVASLSAVLITTLLGSPDAVSAMHEYAPWLIVGLNAANLFLRFITSTPIFNRPPAPPAS